MQRVPGPNFQCEGDFFLNEKACLWAYADCFAILSLFRPAVATEIMPLSNLLVQCLKMEASQVMCTLELWSDSTFCIHGNFLFMQVSINMNADACLFFLKMSMQTALAAFYVSLPPPWMLSTDRVATRTLQILNIYDILKSDRVGGCGKIQKLHFFRKEKV